MTQLKILFLLMAMTVAGCDGIVSIDVSGPTNAVARTKEMPVVNLPLAMRQPNWLGPKGQGCCAFASIITPLRWAGREHAANRIKAGYGDGCNSWRMNQALEAEGIRYAYTIDGDAEFLQWACESRRGCAVVIQGGQHMVCLVHFDDELAGILDPNDVTKIHWYPREKFLSEWRHSSGWAVTPIYGPAPPLPKVQK